MPLAEQDHLLVNWSSPSCCCAEKWARWCKSFCGVKQLHGWLHLAQTPAHPPPFAISLRQEIPPHTPASLPELFPGILPTLWVKIRLLGMGLGVPKPTHSASQQENLVTGLGPPNPIWVCLLRVRSSRGQLGGFNLLCQHSNLMMTHGLQRYHPAEVTALRKTSSFWVLKVISVNKGHAWLSQRLTPPLTWGQPRWAKWCNSATLLKGAVILVLLYRFCMSLFASWHGLLLPREL